MEEMILILLITVLVACKAAILTYALFASGETKAGIPVKKVS